MLPQQGALAALKTWNEKHGGALGYYQEHARKSGLHIFLDASTDQGAVDELKRELEPFVPAGEGISYRYYRD